MASEEKQIELRELVNNLCIEKQAVYNADTAAKNALFFNHQKMQETINKSIENLNQHQTIDNLGQKWKR